MKKIIALLLALTCVFALAACGDEPDPTPTPDGGDNTNTYEDLAPFTAAIAASNPASASINVAQTSTQFNVTMNGEYDVVYNEDGSATVEYSYDKYNEITDDTTEVTTTVTGTATVDKDGNVTGSLNTTVTAATAIKVTLDGAKLGDYTVASGALIAKVAAADTASVLGVAISADVTLTITVANGNVATMTISYESTVGPVEIVCSYNY